MNKVILCGRLTADPEVRYAREDLAIANFAVAVDRKFKKDGEPTADFLRCVAFGKTAETIEKFFSKGRKILLEGHIQTGSYTKDDGSKVYTTDVVVESFYFVESKNDSGNGSEETQQSAPRQNKAGNSGGGSKGGKAKKDEYPEGFEALEDELPF